MTTQPNESFLEKHIRWLAARFTSENLGECEVITTPYMDRHNDCLQIYLRRENGNLIITDEGYIMDDLKASGCVLDTPKRQDLLKLALNGFDIKLQEDALFATAQEANVSAKAHNLLQCMLAVNDLFYVAQPVTMALFRETVETWFATKNIDYSPGIKLTGKSGLQHSFDFEIPKSKDKPQRIVKAMGSPTNQGAKNVIFAWLDTEKVRESDSTAYVFLNDLDKKKLGSISLIMNKYDIKTIPWSKHEMYLDELAA